MSAPERGYVCQYPHGHHLVAEPCERYVPAFRGRGFNSPSGWLWLCPYHYELAAQRWGVKCNGEPEAACHELVAP